MGVLGSCVALLLLCIGIMYRYASIIRQKVRVFFFDTRHSLPHYSLTPPITCYAHPFDKTAHKGCKVLTTVSILCSMEVQAVSCKIDPLVLD